LQSRTCELADLQSALTGDFRLAAAMGGLQIRTSILPDHRSS
jgi:hypothetical protein